MLIEKRPSPGNRRKKQLYVVSMRATKECTYKCRLNGCTHVNQSSSGNKQSRGNGGSGSTQISQLQRQISQLQRQIRDLERERKHLENHATASDDRLDEVRNNLDELRNDLEDALDFIHNQPTTGPQGRQPANDQSNSPSESSTSSNNGGNWGQNHNRYQHQNQNQNWNFPGNNQGSTRPPNKRV